MRVDANMDGAGHYIVFLDDVDISASCFEADDQLGWARCYKTDEQGHIIADPDTHLPIEILRQGSVRIVRRASLEQARSGLDASLTVEMKARVL